MLSKKMKRLLGARAAALALAMLLFCLVPQANAATAIYTATASRVNVRENPSTDADILTVIRKGSEMTFLGVADGWIKVSVGGKTGYVSAEFAVLSDILSGNATLSAETTAKVYLREAPSSSASKVNLLTKGAPLSVLGKNGDWLQVSSDGQTGYVSADYIKLTSSSASAATTVPVIQPTPTPAPEETAFVSLKKGSKGDAVKAVQKRLIELNYLAGKADGVFGNDTEAALKAFQQAKGLAADGIADKATMAALNAADTQPTVTEPPVVIITPTTAPAQTIPTSSTLKKGSKGDAVRLLQQKLISLNYLTGTADGIFGKDTEDAVEAFQKAYGLKSDGVAGASTLAALNGIAASAPSAPSVQETVLKKGSEGDAVRQLQLSLISLGYLVGEADGRYGSATKSAVKAFQAANGLYADGVAGEKTLNAITAASAAVSGASTLEQGSKGDAVKAMQQKLISLGYLSGSADGVFGSGTKKAVAAFQKDKNLKSDGIAGASTLAALNQAYTSGSVTGGTTITAPSDIANDVVVIPQTNVSSYPTLKYGDTGSAVEILQTRLKALGYFSGSIGGNFGTLTRSAVTAFQTSASLPADGIVGQTTWAALYSATAPAAKNDILREGDDNADVKAMQQRLIALGYLSGTADGEFGAKTKSAVQLFQSACGLTVDGVAGPQMLSALYADNAPTYVPGGNAPVNPSINTSGIKDTDYDTAAKIIALAKQQLGCAYVYAREDPPYFDCSGLTQYCYRQFGYKLKRTAYDQGYDNTYPKIARIADLQPGDLIYFNTNTTDADLSDHAGIYIGDGNFIHASSSAAKVVINSLNSGYYREHFSWGRRVLNQ